MSSRVELYADPKLNAMHEWRLEDVTKSNKIGASRLRSKIYVVKSPSGKMQSSVDFFTLKISVLIADWLKCLF